MQASRSHETSASLMRVGIVSVAADKLYRSYLGVTPLGNIEENFDVSAWNLDQVYSEQLGHAIKSAFGSTYVVPPDPYKYFAKFNEVAAGGEPNWGGIHSNIMAYCTQNHLGTLVILSKERGILPDSTGRRIPMGVQGTDVNGYLRVSFRLFLYECTKGKLLQSGLLRHSTHNSTMQSLPEVGIPTDLITTPISQWDETRRNRVRQQLAGLAGTAWMETLQSMKIAVALADSADALNKSNNTLLTIWSLAEQRSPLTEREVMQHLNMDPTAYQRGADGTLPGTTYTTDKSVPIQSLTFREAPADACCLAAQSIHIRLDKDDCLTRNQFLDSPVAADLHPLTSKIHVFESADGYMKTYYKEIYQRISGDWKTTIMVDWTGHQCATELDIQHQRCGTFCSK